MAFDEHFVDQVKGLPAVAGRMARPERRPELRAWRGLPPGPPAGQTPGLARQILKRQLEGLEPPGEAFGTHEAIGGRWNWIGHSRSMRSPQGCHPGIASKDHPGIAFSEEMDARRIARILSAAASCKVFAWIEELEGGT